MKYTSIPELPVAISNISFGTWGIGGRTPGLTSYGNVSDNDSIRALEAAIDIGVTLFDTSNVYGAGHSEEILGRAVKPAREKVLIATKVGWPSYDAPSDFSREGMERSLADSLRRLETDYVDILQLHNPPTNWVESKPQIIETFSEMRERGLVKTFGVSVRSPSEITDLLKVDEISFFQVNFNLMDIRIIELDVLNALKQTGKYILARTPLCFGYLTDLPLHEDSFSDGDHRLSWTAEQRQIWSDGAEKMRAIAKQNGISSLTEFALRFCLSFDSVASVITGMLTKDEVQENIRAIGHEALNDHMLQDVISLHKRHLFFTKNSELNGGKGVHLAR